MSPGMGCLPSTALGPGKAAPTYELCGKGAGMDLSELEEHVFVAVDHSSQRVLARAAQARSHQRIAARGVFEQRDDGVAKIGVRWHEAIHAVLEHLDAARILGGHYWR